MVRPAAVKGFSKRMKGSMSSSSLIQGVLGLGFGVKGWRAQGVPRGSYPYPLFFRIPSFMVRICYLKK